MKILLIGGTGNISRAVSELTVARGYELYLLNRGKRAAPVKGATTITVDMDDESAVAAALDGHTFDVVASFINFKPEAIERDVRLFKGRCAQYLFISSASVYQKPLAYPIVTESTPLANPFWEYSRNKIACEERLTKAYREEAFPATIIRPSLTYHTVIPAAIGSWDDFTLIERMRAGKPIIVHGDGTSLWTITHAHDFAKGMVGLFGHQQALGEAFHITSDELLTWDQIYEAIAAAAGVSPNIVHIPSDFIAKMVPWQKGGLHGDKAISAIFDNTKIKRFVPDYVATIPFKQGIAQTLRWFEADASRQIIREETNQMMDAILEKYLAVYDRL